MPDLKILPCPFCGDTVGVRCVDVEGSKVYFCERCGARGPTAPIGRVDSGTHALNLWNARDVATEEITKIMARRSLVKFGD